MGNSPYEKDLHLAKTYLREIDLSKMDEWDEDKKSMLCAMEQMLNVLQNFFNVENNTHVHNENCIVLDQNTKDQAAHAMLYSLSKEVEHYKGLYETSERTVNWLGSMRSRTTDSLIKLLARLQDGDHDPNFIINELAKILCIGGNNEKD